VRRTRKEENKDENDWHRRRNTSRPVDRSAGLHLDRRQTLGRTIARLPEAKGTTVSQFATHAGEPGVIYAANNRGLFRSDDAGSSWKDLDVSWPKPGLADGVEALACLSE